MTWFMLKAAFHMKILEAFGFKEGIIQLSGNQRRIGSTNIAQLFQKRHLS
jgi:hypothetical protein